MLMTLKNLLGLRPRPEASAADIRNATAEIEREFAAAEAAIVSAEQNSAKLLLGGTDADISKARTAVRAAREIRQEAGGILDALKPMLAEATKREAVSEVEALHEEIAADEAVLNAEFAAKYADALAAVAGLIARERDVMAKRTRLRALTEAAISSGAAAKGDLPPQPAMLPITAFGGHDLLGSLAQLPDADGRLRTSAAIFNADLRSHTERERREREDLNGRLAAESHARQTREWEKKQRAYREAKAADPRHQSWEIRHPGQVGGPQEANFTASPQFQEVLNS